ncbi:NUDIX hydrolase [Paenibacillus monticola]|uniref:NUDIX hydrolase n=1 Tax=Paenibacillus monticola TaxID=2666075 RepID=UPI00189EDD67|nr:NUDIX domain-containing protein [Paenibacillus monticola]
MDEIVVIHGLNNVPDNDLEFAVIFARYKNQWIISRQQYKNTWEVQGGHRELGENIEFTGARELYEESGAKQFRITPITDYSMIIHGGRSFGRLFYADVYVISELPGGHEIEEVRLVDTFPENMTYVQVHELLFMTIKDNNKDENKRWYTYEIHNNIITLR